MVPRALLLALPGLSVACVPPDLSGAPELGGLSNARCLPIGGAAPEPPEPVAPPSPAPCPSGAALRGDVQDLIGGGSRAPRATSPPSLRAAGAPLDPAEAPR
jgi:hypothetical protein